LGFLFVQALAYCPTSPHLKKVVTVLCPTGLAKVPMGAA
jgi:hypothetical protein